MPKRRFYKAYQGKRAAKTPLLATEKLTGFYHFDLHGCWWETTSKREGKSIWVLGEYPGTYDEVLSGRQIKAI